MFFVDSQEIVERVVSDTASAVRATEIRHALIQYVPQ